MLRSDSGVPLFIHQVLDLLFAGLAFGAAYYTKISLLPVPYAGLTDTYSYTVGLLLMLFSYHFCLKFCGCYRQDGYKQLRQLQRKVFQACLLGSAGVIFLSYLLHMGSISRLLLGISTLYSIILLILFRYTVYRVLAYHRTRDYNTRNILVIGTRERAIDFIRVIQENRESGYRILGCLDIIDQENRVGRPILGDVRIIGTLADFQKILEEKSIDEIIFGLPLDLIDDVHHYIFCAEEMGINIRILPDFQIYKIKYFPSTAHISSYNFLGMSTLSLSSLPQKDNQLFVKNCIDYIGAAIGLLLTSPLFLIIAILIKTTSKGPVFFRQQRIGVNGRQFNMHKFRTMVVNAEELKTSLADNNESDGPVFKIKEDPRITPVGAFLRRTSLDELPQLLNVLRGEMSLVGPRPPVPEEVARYKIWQRRRLSMKPGLTCIWQVSGRNEITFEKWMKLDLEYIDNWSLKLDAILFLKTIREVFLGHGR